MFIVNCLSSYMGTIFKTIFAMKCSVYSFKNIFYLQVFILFALGMIGVEGEVRWKEGKPSPSTGEWFSEHMLSAPTLCLATSQCKVEVFTFAKLVTHCVHNPIRLQPHPSTTPPVHNPTRPQPHPTTLVAKDQHGFNNTTSSSPTIVWSC